MTRPSLVIALHGTRHAAGLTVAGELRDEVARQLPGVDIHLGWVDIHDELLDTTLAGLGPAVVVPAFLTAGYHVEHDVPEAIATVGGRAVASEHIGLGVLGAVRDRLLEAGPLGDAVVLAAAGSKRVGALGEVQDAARVLAAWIDRPVRVGYLYAAHPSVEETVAGLRAEGFADLTVGTYALAPGLYADRLAALDVRAVARPVGLHPEFVTAIAQRYRSKVPALAM
ncbi:sirohydrochlorin chelatase [Nigerium massiliense]|uniref:sirohydrochlorin chelatase n=1 Tax=Nigerium massiliense TaxID=1522317 RepID=UPI00058F8FE2|nr:CbiX/SirB N-terminal domain-containing protein [Nigerium massiliense]